MDQNQPAIYDPDASAAQALDTIYDRMAKRFSPDDFVRVMNIDNETFYWQSLVPSDEHIEIEGSQFMLHKRTTREKPKLWSIPAGGTMVLEGWNAAIMIDKLFKKVLAKNKIGNRPEGQKITNFSWANGQLQDEYIDKIFVGIEKPEFTGKAPVQTPEVKLEVESSVADLAKELNLDAEAH